MGYLVIWKIDSDAETALEAAQEAFAHMQHSGTTANIFTVVNKETNEETEIDLEEHPSNIMGVAGFSQEDFETLALQQGYVFNADQLRDLTENYSFKKWDASISVGAWDQAELIVGMYAREQKVEKQELNMTEECDPGESGEYETNVGKAYYSLNDYNWHIEGIGVVRPIWWKNLEV